MALLFIFITSRFGDFLLVVFLYITGSLGECSVLLCPKVSFLADGVMDLAEYTDGMTTYGFTTETAHNAFHHFSVVTH